MQHTRKLLIAGRRVSFYQYSLPYQQFRFNTTTSTPSTSPIEQPEDPNKLKRSKVAPALSSTLKPREVVDELNRYIIGQADAKRAVAIALRNRWRRHQVGENIRNDVIPKNILMIGPTGCGKTEIARRIAKLSQAPFIKVEATKYTEVGYHGKDVDQIIQNLVDISISMTKKRVREEVKSQVADAVNERLLDLLLGTHGAETQRTNFRAQLIEGILDARTVELDIPSKILPFNFDVSNPGSMVSEIAQLANKVVNKQGSKRADRRTMTIAEARPIIEEHEVEKLLENYDIVKEAISAVEESGIVFIDEIDKIVSTGDYRGADASAEGVQRDLLPLIEGSTISTKQGNVNTDFILFIVSGAFHDCKPSDLLAELQGRLPIRVALKGLTEEDLYRILTEPVTNLIKQQIEMLQTENVELIFAEDAIREIARFAYETNKTVENIGARRLHTIIERVMEEISFEAPEKTGEKIEITREYVKMRLNDMLVNADLRKYIL